MSLHGPRPYFLNLFQIRLPIGGVVSILHRASGMLLALAIPLLLWVWMLSLRSAEDFAVVQAALNSGLGALIALALIWATLHHLLAGLRHLGFDLGWGESRECARRSAWVTLIGAVLLTLVVWF